MLLRLRVTCPDLVGAKNHHHHHILEQGEATSAPLASCPVVSHVLAQQSRASKERYLPSTMAVSIAGSSIRLHVAPPSRRRVSVVSAAAAARLDRRSAALLLLSTAVPAASAATAPPASAAGIGLFGIRKKLERAEEAAVEAVREVEEAAAEAAAVGGEAVKEAAAEAVREVEEAAAVGGEAVKGAVTEAEKEVASEGLQLVAGAELAGDGLVQAAVVAGAEALGVVVGLSVVNGILKPEA